MDEINRMAAEFLEKLRALEPPWAHYRNRVAMIVSQYTETWQASIWPPGWPSPLHPAPKAMVVIHPAFLERVRGFMGSMDRTGLPIFVPTDDEIGAMLAYWALAPEAGGRIERSGIIGLKTEGS